MFIKHQKEQSKVPEQDNKKKYNLFTSRMSATKQVNSDHSGPKGIQSFYESPNDTSGTFHVFRQT